MDSLWLQPHQEPGDASSRCRLNTAWSRAISSASTCPLCRAQGLGILPWSPLAGGFLTGKYDKDQPPPAGARLDKWKDRLAGFDNERNWKILDAVRAVATETESTPAAVSLGVAAQAAPGHLRHLRRALRGAARREREGRRRQAHATIR